MGQFIVELSILIAIIYLIDNIDNSILQDIRPSYRYKNKPYKFWIRFAMYMVYSFILVGGILLICYLILARNESYFDNYEGNTLLDIIISVVGNIPVIIIFSKRLNPFIKYSESHEGNKWKERKREDVEPRQTKMLGARLQYSVYGELKIFTVAKSETFIGRGYDNDIVLSNDSISRRHAKIVFNGYSYEIHDLGSTNKVIVNGAFVHYAFLSDGDIIGLGEVVLYFYN